MSAYIEEILKGGCLQKVENCRTKREEETDNKDSKQRHEHHARILLVVPFVFSVQHHSRDVYCKFNKRIYLFIFLRFFLLIS